jgi:hypothetical protein
MLANWLSANSTLTHLEYVLYVRLVVKCMATRAVPIWGLYRYLSLDALIMLTSSTLLSRDSISGNSLHGDGLAKLINVLKCNARMISLR